MKTDIVVIYNGNTVCVPVTYMLPATGCQTEFQINIEHLLADGANALFSRAADSVVEYMHEDEAMSTKTANDLTPRNVIVWRKDEWGILFDVDGVSEIQMAAVFKGNEVTVGPHDILL